MTKNKKAYCNFLKSMMLTLVICVGITVTCSNYGEPPLVEVQNNK